jgi:hypothetical protein
VLARKDFLKLIELSNCTRKGRRFFMANKRILKHILIAILSTALVFSLVACGSKTKRVGDADFGYVTVPSTWEEETDSSGVYPLLITHAPDDSLAIAMLINVDLDLATAIASFETGLSSLEITDRVDSVITLDKGKITEVTKISFHYITFNQSMTIYYFEGPDGLVHYASVEGSSSEYEKTVSDFESSFSFSK